MTTFTLGADAARGRWLGGVALAHSTGEGGFRDHAHTDHDSLGSGRLESTLTSVHPYLRFRANERLSLWGVLGYGTGDLALAVDASGNKPRKTRKTDTGMGMAAEGARGVLVPAASTGGLEIAARTDAQQVRMTSAAATGRDAAGRLAASESQTSRVRLILEASHSIEFGGGQTLRPGLEVGVRHDGGDAETGTGIEIGGGLNYSDSGSGLGVDVQARSLLAHEDADYREWGGSVSLTWDGDPSSDRGLSLSLGRSRGTATGGAERLWSLTDARELASEEGGTASGRLEAEVGYGFSVFDDRGLAIPHARWSS